MLQKHTYFCSYLTTKPLSDEFAKVLSEAPQDDEDYTPTPNRAVQPRSYKATFVVKAQMQTEHNNIVQARVPKVHHSASG